MKLNVQSRAALIVICVSALLVPLPLLAATAKIEIDTVKTIGKFSPTMHGIFFEDINYAADGGLYAELIQNRSFEHREKLYSWQEVKRGGAGGFAIATENPVHPNNPGYRDKQTGETILAVTNPGGEGLTTQIKLSGVKTILSPVKVIELGASSPDDENTFEQPRKVAPQEETFSASGTAFAREFPPWSLTILRFKRTE